jgi:hypothetical protein
MLVVLVYNKNIMPSAVVRGRERLIAGDALGSLTRRCNQLRKKRFFVQPMEVSGYSSAVSASRVTQAGASSEGISTGRSLRHSCRSPAFGGHLVSWRISVDCGWRIKVGGWWGGMGVVVEVIRRSIGLVTW